MVSLGVCAFGDSMRITSSCHRRCRALPSSLFRRSTLLQGLWSLILIDSPPGDDIVGDGRCRCLWCCCCADDACSCMVDRKMLCGDFDGPARSADDGSKDDEDGHGYNMGYGDDIHPDNGQG
eukprot:s1796_g14.t1